MIKVLSAIFFAVVAAGVGTVAHAAQSPSLELGKQLFNDPALGGATGAKTCASCHPKGAGLEFSSESPKLAQNINTCLVRAMNGSALPLESVEMQSLILYHQSFK